ncbi:MAG: hypothetical protein ACOCV1_03145 [Bacillota bacterium]
MIDYDNSTFNDIWDYELEEGLEKRDLFNFSSSLLTGKFYDDKNGIIYYMKNSLYHREDGPAYIYRGSRSYNNHFIWYNYGIEHRIEGPAKYVFYNINCSSKEYWIFGRWISEFDFLTFSNLDNGNKVVLL